MKTALYRGVTRTYIQTGEHHACGGEGMISTLLGSCVAACLWDPVSGVIGMNHFLLASDHRRGSGSVVTSASGMYGIQAMELLINDMLKAGANRAHLRAKAFGGARLNAPEHDQSPVFAVGDMNARFIREFLDKEGIPLEASDLGGDHARLIHFSAHDYSVYLRRSHPTQRAGVIEKEQKYWRHQLRQQQVQRPAVHYW